MVIVSPGKVGIQLLWFWSCPPPPSQPLETGWFLQAIDHNFEGIIFVFGIHLWLDKVLPPIENGQGRVISLGMGSQKPTKLNIFSYFSLCA
jgi:hypothetical protein